MSERNDKSGTNPAARAARDLVYGVGKTGLSIARYLQRNDRNAIYVDTRRAPPGLDALRDIVPDAEIYPGATPDNLLDDVIRIVVSPGISDRDPLLAAARARGIEVVSDIQLFVESARAPFAAITGSNGKSTVTTLLAQMCRAAGKTALAGANLGEPALDLLVEAEPDIYILELSSFQLQRTQQLPAKVAVLLDISADHLDWHRDEAEYRAAKYRILRDADCVVINREDPEARQHVGRSQTCRSFGLDEPRRRNFGLLERNGEPWLARGDTPLLAVASLALVGVHNQANALAALAAGDLLGLDTDAMVGVLRRFPGLPHRMQLTRRIGNAAYVNDSKATNVAAAIAAIRSIAGPVVLIAGGQGKGGDFARLADAVRDKLRAAVLIGEDADAIGAAFAARTAVSFATSMPDAVQQAAQLARPGDTVLLAPACASFDQFDNYMQRGDAFCAAVEALPS
ncbi:MAG: UDP-N-acetylmuramoyl-L-alanine--D-glutamate ligase [Woeseiaceae bacterium]|nr:UDP-N-acetylmuramoyl-L-alanine--D-glutamate ligase [Woeseiaceae bacterium]